MGERNDFTNIFSNYCRKLKFIIKYNYFKHFFTCCERMSYLVFKTSQLCRLFVSSNNIDGKQLMYL